MAEEDKHIYRNSNGLLGGVCAGIAERFDFDVALLRLSVIILSLLTAGAFVLVYVAVWLILPAKPLYGATVDVNPDSFQSEVYEQVIKGVSPKPGNMTPSIPPVPPAAASGYYQQAPRVSYAAVPAPANAGASVVQDSLPARPVKIGLVAGIALIMLGALVFWADFVSFDVGAWAGVASPFLLICVGLFIMGRASKSNILLVCAGLAFIAFLAVGVYNSVLNAPLDFGTSLSFSPETLQEISEG